MPEQKQRLRHSSDSEPGYSRKRMGRYWAYFDEAGERVTDRDTIDRLNSLGVPNSGKVDRFWFRSLYFREPNGVLFEIATEGPGFGVDEDLATLGEKVVLPPFLEKDREAIVANLKPID